MQSENEGGCVIRQCVGKKFPAKALGVEMFSTATIKSDNNKKGMSESTNTHICPKLEHWDNQSLQFCHNSASFAYSWDVGFRLAAPCSWLKARQSWGSHARSAVSCQWGFLPRNPVPVPTRAPFWRLTTQESTSVDLDPPASTPAISASTNSPEEPVGNRNFAELINVMLQTKKSSFSSK